MSIADYENVFALWHTVNGVGLSAADELDAIERYLNRNNGISFVALNGQTLVGAVLCGHDGRRGFIHHLAVQDKFRRLGIGRQLVQHCLEQLRLEGIQKCHLFVFKENHEAIKFWEQIGFAQRDELSMMSIFIKD